MSDNRHHFVLKCNHPNIIIYFDKTYDVLELQNTDNIIVSEVKNFDSILGFCLDMTRKNEQRFKLLVESMEKMFSSKDDQINNIYGTILAKIDPVIKGAITDPTIAAITPIELVIPFHHSSPESCPSGIFKSCFW